MSFKTVIAKAVADAEKVKADLAKVANSVEGAAVKLENDAPEIQAVAEAIFPGIAQFVPLGVSCLEGLADVLNSGSAAAQQNLANSGLDIALINAVKAQIANIKKLV